MERVQILYLSPPFTPKLEERAIIIFLKFYITLGEGASNHLDIDTQYLTPQEKERLLRKTTVNLYFSHMDPDLWEGLKQEDLVQIVEGIHTNLAKLDPREVRDTDMVGKLREDLVAEFSVLNRHLQEFDGPVISVLFQIARGVQNSPTHPLSSNQPIPAGDI